VIYSDDGAAIHDEDAVLNASLEPHFNEVLAARLSRRSVMGGGLAAAAAFLAGSNVLTGVAAAHGRGRGHEQGRGKGHSKGGGPGQAPAPELLGFSAIPLGYGDEVVVPPGYTARPLIPWGTPILGGYPAFVPGTPPLVANGNTAAQQAEQVGMDHDGMHYFALSRGPGGNERGLLVVNNEATDEGYLHTGTLAPPSRDQYTADMVRKSQNAHGVTVVEIARNHLGEWEVVRGPYNRRLTANTPMTLSGPAAGHRLVVTPEDPEGRTPLGTFNNCAHGFTPWGTYLTCEENFNGYFRLDPGPYDPEHDALNKRYGVGGDRYNWTTHDDRFVVTADDPNEPNRFGWVVEVHPLDPQSTPVKRTALGRMKHEGAFVHIGKGGRVVVYMGDDQTNEYVYKFVSAGNARSLLARGGSPLDEGILYVARFNDDGSGEWLPLVHGQGALTSGNGYADQGDVLVKTRLAAAALGATPMDRPEWTSVDAKTGFVYVTLTNNTSSSKIINAANPRKPNTWGHILRWQEAGGDHTATTFSWDIFVLAGPGGVDGSTNDAEDAFGSPDGLWVDPDSRVWIQTDGKQPGGANNQMLAANPYVLDARGVPEIRRFFTGVVGCEVTGVITTPDGRTMFTNVQHPGEEGGSRWPHNDGLDTPRASTVVVTKDDGGVIGT
jgi:hypothetical protein